MKQPIQFPRPDHAVVQVCNSSAVQLEPGSAAAFTDSGTRNAAHLPPLFNIRPALPDDSFWGIVNQSLAPGMCGSMTLTGVVSARIVAGTGNFVHPGTLGLVAQNSGRGQILYRGKSAAEDSLLLLGNTFSSAVITDFQVIFVPETHSIKVVSGFRMDSPYCGLTDLPGAEAVPPAELPLPDGDVKLYLNACYDRDKGTYSTVFDYTITGFAHQLIAGVSYNGAVVQYFNGTMICFKREWFL